MSIPEWQEAFLHEFAGLDYLLYHLDRIMVGWRFDLHALPLVFWIYLLMIRCRMFAILPEQREVVAAILISIQRITLFVCFLYTHLSLIHSHSQDKLSILVDHVELLLDCLRFVPIADKLLLIEVLKLLYTTPHQQYDIQKDPRFAF